jgi:hypothetical protein
VLVVSIQADGQASVYFPFRGRRSLPLDSDGEVALPGSVIMDDSTSDELLVAIFTSTPLSSRRALAAARKAYASSGERLEKIGRLPLDGDQSLHLLRRGEGAP